MAQRDYRRPRPVDILRNGSERAWEREAGRLSRRDRRAKTVRTERAARAWLREAF